MRSCSAVVASTLPPSGSGGGGGAEVAFDVLCSPADEVAAAERLAARDGVSAVEEVAEAAQRDCGEEA